VSGASTRKYHICTRCLSIAAVPTARPVARNAALRRTFTSSAASKQCSKPRQIHNSARQRAAQGVDSLHQPANEIPPNITPRGRTTDKQREDEIRAMLQPDNLFHSFSNSPSPAIRQRAAVMKQNAYLPRPMISRPARQDHFPPHMSAMNVPIAAFPSLVPRSISPTTTRLIWRFAISSEKSTRMTTT
jgi:hypothetical protein